MRQNIEKLDEKFPHRHRHMNHLSERSFKSRWTNPSADVAKLRGLGVKLLPVA